mmetsp:Transcript_13387/g.23349  ORF Transcript_13387/g.23349 Transcript_13387/m.23349 type:complete len:218 (-) Transcript_13387:237-890(-)
MFVNTFEPSDEFSQIVCRQVRIFIDSFFVFDIIQLVLKEMSRNFQHDIAKHFQETSVGIPCKSWIASFFGQSFDNLVIHSQVQNCVHHSWHANGSSRSDGQKQRILGRSKLRGHFLFDHGQGCDDLFPQGAGKLLVPLLVITIAAFGRNGKSRWHAQSERMHFRQIGTLPPENVFSSVSDRFGIATKRRNGRILQTEFFLLDGAAGGLRRRGSVKNG